MKNLKQLQAEATKANESMQNTNFIVEYQRKGIVVNGEYIANCYILKESGDIEATGSPVEIIARMQEMTDQMTTEI